MVPTHKPLFGPIRQKIVKFTYQFDALDLNYTAKWHTLPHLLPKAFKNPHICRPFRESLPTASREKVRCGPTPRFPIDPVPVLLKPAGLLRKSACARHIVNRNPDSARLSRLTPPRPAHNLPALAERKLGHDRNSCNRRTDAHGSVTASISDPHAPPSFRRGLFYATE